MSKRSATRSNVPGRHEYHDGMNVPVARELDEQIAEALAEWPQHDAKHVEKLTDKIMQQLDEDPPAS